MIILMKKRRLLTLFLLLLLAVSSAALADGETPAVPDGVRAYLSGSRWSDWEITGWAHPGETLTSGACAFLAVKSGATNDLLAFGWVDGQWAYKWHNAAALPQVAAPVLLHEDNAGTGFVSLYVVNNEIDEMHCHWELRSDGDWHLSSLFSYDPIMFFDTVTPGVLRLYNDGWVSDPTDVKVYGQYQTKLRYFKLSAFPMTVKEARAALSNPPSIPAGELTAQNVKFTSGKKYPVYSGPGVEYERAANGKAIVSTNDWIQVFGAENGWILIQYDITSTKMRFGYIEASALPKNASVGALPFSSNEATVAHNTFLTDDPLNSQESLRALAAGESVTWLCVMGDWAYVELQGAVPIRGFMPADAITAGKKRATYTPSATFASYAASATVDVVLGESVMARVDAQMPSQWLADDLDSGLDYIIGYQLYLNGEESVLSSPAGGDGDHLYFTLEAPLTAPVTVLGLCPVYTLSGSRAEETLVVVLN